MSSMYTPSPVLKYAGGLIVLTSVEGRFHAFLRCRATRFLTDGELEQAGLTSVELCENANQFKDVTARLTDYAILQPLEGGVPVSLYLARPRKEAAFRDLVQDLQEEDGLRLLEALPDEKQAVLLVFGDPDEVEAHRQRLSEAAAQAPAPEPEAVEEPPAPPPAAPVAQPTPPPAVPPPAAPEPAKVAPAPAAPIEAVPPEAPKPVAPPAEAPSAEAAVEAPAKPPPAAPPPVEPPPTKPAAEAPAEPAPAKPAPAEPMPAEPAPVSKPEPPAAAKPEPEPPPPPKRRPSPPPLPEPEPPPVKSPAALNLGGAYYVLRYPDITGSTVVVWQARRLTSAPDEGEFEIIRPNAAGRARLLAEAEAGVTYADKEIGELVAVKIARPEKEQDLERALTALRRLGPRALRLYYPGQGEADPLWLPEFPCTVVEWAGGVRLNESPALTEARGLDLCLQLADLLAAAREAAPDIVFTDSLKPDNVVVVYDAQGNLQARIIDWNVYATADADVRETTLKRFGEIMVHVFTSDMPFAVDWKTGAVPLHLLGAGRPGDPGADEWDALSYGTQRLIRRALQGHFEGAAADILAELRQVLAEQKARWAENDPAWQARLESGPPRLNWLDIAAAKQGRVSAETRARLMENRRRELRAIVDERTETGQHLEAVVDLNMSVRRHPDDAYFRWALLAHTIGVVGPERAFRRLHLDEALPHMDAGRHAQAQSALERGLALFNDVNFAADQRDSARGYLEALALYARTLALADSAQAALADDWRVEDAEFRLALAEDLQTRAERLARRLLAGRDPLCRQRLEELRGAIADFYEAHEQYDPAAIKSEAVEQGRRSNFEQLLTRARSLAAQPEPEVWTTALQVYDRLADEYADLWRVHGDQERAALVMKRAQHWLDDAKSALKQADWPTARTALAQAVLYPTTQVEALRLQSALAAYERGEAELRRGDFSPALASFAFAAENSGELKGWAEMQTQAVKKAAKAAGRDEATALTAMTEAIKLDVDRVNQTLQEQFAAQQTALNRLLQDASRGGQAQSAQSQAAALKQLQDEQWERQQALLRQLQEDQLARLQKAMSQMQEDQTGRQREALRRLHEEQLAQIKSTLVTLHDDQSVGQATILKELQGAPAGQSLPSALQRLQEDLATQQQTALKRLRDELLERHQEALQRLQENLSSALPARQGSTIAIRPAQTVQPGSISLPAGDQSVIGNVIQDLSWQMQDTADRQDSLARRVAQIFWLNIVMVLVLLGLLGAVGYSLWRQFGVTGAVAVPATETAVAQPTTVPPTAAPSPTPVPPSPTPAASPTPRFMIQFGCADAATARSFYSCWVTNDQAAADRVVLEFSPIGGQLNGFNPSVRFEGQDVLLADRQTLRVSLGEIGPGETRSFQLNLPCIQARCVPTTFIITPLVNQGAQPVPGAELTIATEFLPNVQPTP